MAVFNGKIFDITMVVRKFNSKQSILLADIARDFDLSEEELIELLQKGASPTERTMVRQAITQNEKRKAAKMRKKRKSNKRERAISQTQYEEATMKRLIPTVAEQRESLEQELSELRAKASKARSRANAARTMVDSTRSLVEYCEEQTQAVSEEVEVARKKVQEAELGLIKAKKAFDSAEEEHAIRAKKLASEKAKLEKLLESEAKEEALIARLEEEMEFIQLQIEELEKVYLIAPDWHGKEMPSGGRLISNCDFEGVEVKHSNRLDDLRPSDLFTLCQESGYNDFLEFGAAYEFALVASEYLSDDQTEAEVVTDDERIQKLISLVS